MLSLFLTRWNYLSSTCLDEVELFFFFCHVMKAILKSAIRMNVIFSHINASYLLSTDREKCSYCEALSFFDYPLSSKFLIWICTPAESNRPKKKFKWHVKYCFQVEFYYFFFASVLTSHTENAKTNIITNWKINLNETTIRFPQRFFINYFAWQLRNTVKYSTKSSTKSTEGCISSHLSKSRF